MKIILFVNKDIEANLLYNLLKSELQQHQVRIYYSASVGRKSSKPAQLIDMEHYEKDKFYGEIKDQYDSLGLTDFEFFGEQFSSYPMERCHNVNAPEFVAEVSAWEPDLFISVRFGKIFKEPIIPIPKKGIINLHSAILPDYRGILGTLHNLKDPSQSQYGCTLHYISSSGIDTGEIIDVAKLPIHTERSLLWHVVQLYPAGCQMIIHALRTLEHSDRLPVQLQDLTTGSYHSVPTVDDFEKLSNRGIDTVSEHDYRDLIHRYISNEIEL